MIEKIKQHLSWKTVQRILKVFGGAWAAVCIIMFMLVPGRVSYLHSALLDNIIFLPLILRNFDFVEFATNLAVSFLQIVFVFIVYSFVGAGFIPKVSSEEDDFLPRGISPIISLASSFLMGHWLFAIVFFGLAYFKNLTATTITAALITGILVSAFAGGYRCFIISIRALNKSASEVFRTGYPALNILSTIMLFSALGLSVARLSYDSVYLYFSDPKGTAVLGQLHFFHENYYTISSFQTSIHFAALITLFGDQTARLYSWVAGILVLVFGLGIGRETGISNKAKSILTVMILSTTAITDMMGDGKVDLVSAAVVLAAIYWMRKTNSWKATLTTGVFIGLAISSRPYNLLLVGMFVVLAYLIKIYHARSNPQVIKELFTSALFVSLGAALPMILNLLANWAVFGSPFAMFSAVNTMSAEKWYPFDPSYVRIMRLTLPFAVTFLNSPQSLGNLTPVFLGFLPFLFISDVQKKIFFSQALSDLLIAALPTLTVWICAFFTVMEIRYIFFLWIILYLPVAEAVAYAFENQNLPLQKLSVVLVYCLMVFSVVRTAFIPLVTYAPLDKQGNPQCHHLIFCDYLQSINDNAPHDARVLTLSAYRYYLRTDLLTCSTVSSEYQALRTASQESANAFWEEVYRQGYTYIAYEHEYTMRHLHIDFEPTPTNAPSWLTVTPIYNSPGDLTVAYKLTANNPPIQPQKHCVVQSNNAWEVEPVIP